MKPLALVLLIAALCLPLIGCGDPDDTRIRLTNRGDVAIEGVRVTFPPGPVGYGDLPPGGTTDYRPAPGAYAYAKIEATIAGRPVMIQPTDYVGEKPLDGGRYTYALTPHPKAEDAYSRLTMSLIED